MGCRARLFTPDAAHRLRRHYWRRDAEHQAMARKHTRDGGMIPEATDHGRNGVPMPEFVLDFPIEDVREHAGAMHTRMT